MSFVPAAAAPTRFLITPTKLEMIDTSSVLEEASGSSSLSVSNLFFLFCFSTVPAVGLQPQKHWWCWKLKDFSDRIGIKSPAFGGPELSRKGFWELSLRDQVNSVKAVHDHHCQSLENKAVCVCVLIGFSHFAWSFFLFFFFFFSFKHLNVNAEVWGHARSRPRWTIIKHWIWNSIFFYYFFFVGNFRVWFFFSTLFFYYLWSHLFSFTAYARHTDAFRHFMRCSSRVVFFGCLC